MEYSFLLLLERKAPFCQHPTTRVLPTCYVDATPRSYHCEDGDDDLMHPALRMVIFLRIPFCNLQLACVRYSSFLTSIPPMASWLWCLCLVLDFCTYQ